MLRNMEFITQANGGDRFATLDIESQVLEMKKFLEERYDDAFRPRQFAYKMIKEVVNHIVRQSNDSLATIAQRYSISSDQYFTLLPYVVKIDHDFRTALHDLASDDTVIGQVEFSENSELMVVQLFSLDISHGQTRFDQYVDNLRDEGTYIHREVEKLLQDWKSLNPKFHFRHQEVGDRQSLRRTLDLSGLAVKGNTELPSF